MPFIKDSLSLLIEASAMDLKNDTSTIVRESAVRSGYNKIESVYSDVVYTPEMVTIVNVDGEYFTEMNFLHPYMKTNNIKSITEALNNIATANGLLEGSVGLLIESDEEVNDTIDKAIESGNVNKKENVFTKIGKAINLTNKLKDSGIKVKKKKNKKK